MGPLSQRHLLLLILLGAGCGTGDTPRQTIGSVQFDTVAGLVAVRNHGPGAWGARPRWTVGGTPIRIGGIDSPGEESFGAVAGVAVGPGRRVYVADGQAREIQVFRPDGQFLRRIGREGEGPGEFRSIDALTFSADSQLVVRDPQLARISFFTADGQFQRSFRLQRPFIQFTDRTTLWMDTEGWLYDRVSLSLGARSTDSVAVVVYRPDGAVADTVLLTEQPQQVVLITRAGVPVGGLRLPYAPATYVAVDRHGRIAWGVGDHYAITLANRHGVRLQTIERLIHPARLSAAARDAARRALEQQAAKNFPAAQLHDYRLPEMQPQLTDLVVDHAGYWWVGRNGGQRNDPQPTEYDVFEPDGRYLGVLYLPAMRITDIGPDFIAGVQRDSLDVDYAVVFPLVRSSGR